MRPEAIIIHTPILNSDSGFGYVGTILSAATQVTVKAAVTVAQDGDVRIEVNGQTGRAVIVSTVSKPAAQVNAELVSGLQANDFAASLQGGNIVITKDLSNGSSVNTVFWEDNDSGITAIGSSTSGGAAPIPTLSPWGILLLVAMLMLASWIVRRRAARRAAAPRPGA